MSTVGRLRDIIEPIVTGLDLELFDLEYTGGIVAVTIDRPPVPQDDQDDQGNQGATPSRVDLGDITAVTRAVSRALDEHDPIAGHYSLEVSSPGLERQLRTPLHFERAVGQVVNVKTMPGFEGGRRLKGTLVGSDDEGIDLAVEGQPGETVHLAYDDIEKTRTVFEWGPEPKPGKPGKPAKPAKAKPGKTTSGKTTGKAKQSEKSETTATPGPGEKKVSAE